MKNVYILTEYGNTYTKEGLKVVTDAIKKNFGYTDEITFVMGAAYIKAKHLKRELEDHPDDTSWYTAIRFFIDDIDLENR